MAKTITTLAHRDIIKIIAEHYHIPERLVTLKIGTRWEGHGPCEHLTNYVEALVEHNEKEQENV